MSWIIFSWFLPFLLLLLSVVAQSYKYLSLILSVVSSAIVGVGSVVKKIPKAMIKISANDGFVTSFPSIIDWRTLFIKNS
jgi:hypothetical protein